MVDVSFCRLYNLTWCLVLALQCSYDSWHALSRLMWSVLALATSMAIMALLTRYWYPHGMQHSTCTLNNYTNWKNIYNVQSQGGLIWSFVYYIFTPFYTSQLPIALYTFHCSIGKNLVIFWFRLRQPEYF